VAEQVFVQDIVAPDRDLSTGKAVDQFEEALLFFVHGIMTQIYLSEIREKSNQSADSAAIPQLHTKSQNLS
jgi:hypothetical protein